MTRRDPGAAGGAVPGSQLAEDLAAGRPYTARHLERLAGKTPSAGYGPAIRLAARLLDEVVALGYVPPPDGVITPDDIAEWRQQVAAADELLGRSARGAGAIRTCTGCGGRLTITSACRHAPAGALVVDEGRS